MNEIESQLKKGNDLEEKIETLTKHIRELRKENKELKSKIDTIYDAVEEGAVTSEERNKLRVEGMNGGPANPEIGKVMKKAKKGNGVEPDKVEVILDCSRRHALKMMRKIEDNFENFKFIKGKGNKASRLKNFETTEDAADDIF